MRIVKWFKSTFNEVPDSFEESVKALTPNQRREVLLSVIPTMIMKFDELAQKGEVTKEYCFDKLVELAKDLE